MNIEDINAARQRLAGHIELTACERSDTLSKLLGCDLYIKFENQQYTASFKERGALNCLFNTGWLVVICFCRSWLIRFI